MNRLWRAWCARTLGFLLSAALLGWLANQITLALLLACLVLLGWHSFHLYRLLAWLHKGVPSRPASAYPLRSDALWQEVYQRCFRLRQRSRKRKRKVSRILKQFQSAAAAVPDAVVVLADDGTVEWCNEASRRLLGLRARQDIGLQINTLVRHPRFIEFLNQRHYESSLEFPSPNNPEMTLSLRIVPYGKKQRLLLAADVSRVQRLEQMRRDFVANVSHELRTPLTVIIGYLETLLDDEDNVPQRWQRPLRGMHQQSHRMLRIIEDLLLLSRLEMQTERPPPRPVAVPALIATIAEDAQALSGEHNHQIRLQVDPRLWVCGHEPELRSAFSNLLFNAVRYTPDGSQIVVRWYGDERGAHLEVEDNGEGIPPQHLQRITERFYRVNRDRSRDRGGTGLGLAIVKHVMKNHGGNLGITSLVGIGSLFACDFPPELVVHPETAAGETLAVSAG